MNILAFDTSGPWLTVAVKIGDEMKFSQLRSEKRQSDVLVKEIDEIVKFFDVSISDFQIIGCITGPGNFTGLRSGIAVAKAISFSLSLPIVGMKYFEPFKTEGPVTLIRKARKNWWYTSTFDRNVWQCDLVPSDQLFNAIGEKHAFSEERIEGLNFLSILNPVISGYDLLEKVIEDFDASENIYDHVSIKPFYAQKPVAEEKFEEKTDEIRN